MLRTVCLTLLLLALFIDPGSTSGAAVHAAVVPGGTPAAGLAPGDYPALATVGR